MNWLKEKQWTKFLEKHRRKKTGTFEKLADVPVFYLFTTSSYKKGGILIHK